MCALQRDRSPSQVSTIWSVINRAFRWRHLCVKDSFTETSSRCMTWLIVPQDRRVLLNHLRQDRATPLIHIAALCWMEQQTIRLLRRWRAHSIKVIDYWEHLTCLTSKNWAKSRHLRKSSTQPRKSLQKRSARDWQLLTRMRKMSSSTIKSDRASKAAQAN